MLDQLHNLNVLERMVSAERMQRLTLKSISSSFASFRIPSLSGIVRSSASVNSGGSSSNARDSMTWSKATSWGFLTPHQAWLKSTDGRSLCKVTLDSVPIVEEFQDSKACLMMTPWMHDASATRTIWKASWEGSKFYLPEKVQAEQASMLWQERNHAWDFMQAWVSLETAKTAR